MRTAKRRPDLCRKAVLDKKDRKFIAQEGLEDYFDLDAGTIPRR